MILALTIVCLVAVVAVFVLSVSQARLSARADKAEAEEEQAAAEALRDQRVGHPDRRLVTRTWPGSAPGRRREDELRAEIAALRHALEATEARLAEAERRRGSA